jgi:hypothetical protein
VTIHYLVTATASVLTEIHWTIPSNSESVYADALQEAADPNTTAWRLAALAVSVDRDVRVAVAANPSTSALTLLRLRRDLDPRVLVVLSARREADR